jgi:hypothetical protein
VPEATGVVGKLDTGCNFTCIEIGILRNLGMNPKKKNGCQAGVVGSREQVQGDSYEVEMALSLPNGLGPWLTLDVCGLPLARGLLTALFGQDFLRHFKLTYDGPRSQATLDW